MATTRDGFIAKAPGHAPADWVSPEEQALFFRDVAEADWAVMGRGTHEAAPRADRRRIVFSRRKSGWQTKCQFWCDPGRISMPEIVDEVAKVHVLRQGLILGGTRVHDWFRDQRAIDQVHLTVEPITWGDGLPLFSGQEGHDPLGTFERLCFRKVEEHRLNAGGTMWYHLERQTEPAN